jgi:hypothetical protein
VATRLFPDAHLEQLRSFPDIDRDQLIRSFTLTPANAAFIYPDRGLGPAGRLGLFESTAVAWPIPVPAPVTRATRPWYG